MGRLIYVGIGSLDGYFADTEGNFDWSAPDEEVHAYLNARDAAVSAELYGRRLYEVMAVWETYGTGPDASPAEREYGEQWRGRDKLVFSRTLTSVPTARTRLIGEFDADEVRAFVDAQPGDVTIGGGELAGVALAAGLVDKVEYYASPVVLGAGRPWLPAGVRLELEHRSTHTFGNGVVHTAYRVTR